MCKVAVLSTFTNRSSDLADMPIVFRPGTDLAILNYIANHIITTGRVNQDFVDEPYDLRARARPISATACGPTIRARRGRRVRPIAGATTPIDFDAYAAFVKDYTLEKVSELTGVERGFLQELAELYADPKRKVMSLWTMGFNQHVRGVWANQLCLQSASADRKDLRAGQRPVLADRPALGLRHRARGRHLRASSAGRHGGDQSRAPQACRGDLARAAAA